MCRTSARWITLLATALVVVGLAGTAALAQVPSNCDRNCLHIDSIAPDKFVVINGEQRTWDFTVSNQDTAGSTHICCEADHVTVLFCCPGANGQDPQPQCSGGSRAGLSCGKDADCTGGTCSIPAGCTVLASDITFQGDDAGPHTGTVTNYPANACTVNVNSGVTTAFGGGHAITLNVRTPGLDSQGNAYLNAPVNVATCSVALDKQVSCDGGTNFVDVGEHDSVTQTCTGNVGVADIVVRYVAHNTGTSSLVSCQFGDTNTVVGVPPGLTTSISSGASTTGTTSPLQCETARAGGEPDTGSVTCTCAFSNTGATVSDSDTASFECCGGQVDKQVSCQGGASGTFVDVGFNDNVVQTCAGVQGATDIVVRYVARNTGTIALNNCSIGDSNPLLPGVTSTFSINVSGTTTPVSTNPLTCSTQLASNEPDTATLNCACGNPADNHSMTPATDTASFTCPAICGDSTCNVSSETCDGTVNCAGGTLPAGTCRGTSAGAACQCTFCGDGIVQQSCGEQCEPTGPNDPNCSQTCQFTPHCGDNTCNVQSETCDGTVNCAGGTLPAGTCRGTSAGATCQCTFCGDGIVQQTCGEQCEPTGPNDPNCSQTCQLTPHCGDNTCNVQSETCDGTVNCAGGTLPAGTCRGTSAGATCQCTFCGDGIVQQSCGEECEPTGPNDPNCGTDCKIPQTPFFCRTPGFWGTHADKDPGKQCSQDITAAVIAKAGGSLNICGQCISNCPGTNSIPGSCKQCDNTGWPETLPTNNAASAEEALCTSVVGVKTRQLARQLTSAALNCVFSNGSAVCANNPEIDFQGCNDACALGTDAAKIGACITALDCFNNGLTPPTAGSNSCGGNTGCHDKELPLCDPAFGVSQYLPNCNGNCGGRQGPAGSNEECDAANGTKCTVVGPNDVNCCTDSCP